MKTHKIARNGAQIRQGTGLITTIDALKDNVPTGALVCQETTTTPLSTPGGEGHAGGCRAETGT